MEKGKIVALEDRIPKLKEQRRRKANRRLSASCSFCFLHDCRRRLYTITIKSCEEDYRKRK